ncbi:glycoside hydrolase domain-containing protein [Cohnella phaseoli]|uniref:Uncharacterized protein DUF4091 n=1 Tax=Cohnella phaseoli TaxID=456490 RepID=A0A3D9JQU5_9BACL|nr:glycoside hydrolase domain-containing protein [Cohnella phaseoli]RED76330.1 uncharacterized protein DUF4091 [Cohnella phaseoli]
MAEKHSQFQTRCVSSLVKVFADEALTEASWNRGTALWSETFAFQVAYRSEALVYSMKVAVSSELAAWTTVRPVGLAPSELPTFAHSDDYVLRKTPGLYPDPLYPLPEDGMRAYPGQWRTLWVTVELPSKEAWEAAGGASSGVRSFTFDFHFTGDEGVELGSQRFTLEVLPAELPEQKLIHTEWVHYDCLATYYKLDIFGEKHWELIERYVENAVRHGMNMLLTPLFTPPLDTEIGGERSTVQLIDVERTQDGEYRFGFDKLTRWVEMCDRVGIRYFEFSHLFTQWGAKHAPKIIATVNEDGEKKEQRIFGWETDAAGGPYRQFLSQFLPALDAFIREHKLEDRSYFHVSDEPNLDQLEDYRRASAILKEHLGAYPFIEALSDYGFYEQGLVPVPIPANDHIDKFLENEVPGLWTYYCCGQSVDVSNRFFNMPSARNRILGYQLYKFGIKGFLQWGFNFWNTQHSKEAIDPYRVTDAGGAFPSGDSFAVYPGTDGPLDSIRWEVFREALQDLRACELLESLAGREQVLELLEAGLSEPITFRNYPREASWLLSKRTEINRQIAKLADA